MFGCAMLIGLDKGGIPGLGALGMAFVLSRSSGKIAPLYFEYYVSWIID